MKLGSAARRGIVTGGTWCADHNKFISHWPGEEEIVEIEKLEVRGGGSACNLAIDIRRLDPEIPVSTIGLVGDDEDGHILIAEADAAGVDRAQMSVAPHGRTAHTDAFTSAKSGHRTHFYLPGTSPLLTPDHFDFTEAQARILHLGLPGVHEQLDNPWGADANGWVTVLKKARAAGIATNLELCSLPAERIAETVHPCLAHLDLLIVNDYEIAALAGSTAGHRSQVDAQACLEAARAVLSKGSMKLVVVHFPAGAVAVSASGEDFSRPSVAVPPEEILGTNGAGDAFAAGMLYGLHESWDVVAAIELGHATAASSVRSLGTTDAVISWRDCLELASRWGWRNPV